MAIVVYEDRHQEETKLFSDTGIDRADLGRHETLRYKVLTAVLDERYDTAIQELKEFLEGDSDYPDFRSRHIRYVNHGTDLIYAIKAKRSFPGISSLTRAKQQELREKFKEHLRELQYILKKIEKNQADLRIQDARSTIYVVRALWYSVFSISVLGFFLEVVQGLASTTYVVVNDVLTNFSDWLLHLVGL